MSMKENGFEKVKIPLETKSATSTTRKVFTRLPEAASQLPEAISSDRLRQLAAEVMEPNDKANYTNLEGHHPNILNKANLDSNQFERIVWGMHTMLEKFKKQYPVPTFRQVEQYNALATIYNNRVENYTARFPGQLPGKLDIIPTGLKGGTSLFQEITSTARTELKEAFENFEKRFDFEVKRDQDNRAGFFEVKSKLKGVSWFTTRVTGSTGFHTCIKLNEGHKIIELYQAYRDPGTEIEETRHMYASEIIAQHLLLAIKHAEEQGTEIPRTKMVTIKGSDIKEPTTINAVRKYVLNVGSASPLKISVKEAIEHPSSPAGEVWGRFCSSSFGKIVSHGVPQLGEILCPEHSLELNQVTVGNLVEGLIEKLDHIKFEFAVVKKPKG